MSRRMYAILLSWSLLLLLASSLSPLAAADVDRDRLARGIYRHDFENRRDPDTGLPAPDSASLANAGWPDFWEPVRAVGFPDYLINEIAIVPDPSGQVPGAYRDVLNHALRLGYDGTRVGVRTRIPVPVDPGLAYEFSLLAKDAGLGGAKIRAGVEWLRIDSMSVEVLRADEIPDLLPGQIDWPVSPARLQVNDPPADANAARMFVIVERDPNAVGGAYHGQLWLDNIALRPLPRVVIQPLRESGPGGGRIIPVRYSGLLDNVPDPASPGYFRGKRYFRRVEITDVFNQPLNLGDGGRRRIEADENGQAVEEIPFPRAKFGVYYFNIRLYDADDRLAADVIRSVAVLRPERQADSLARRPGRPIFGVGAGPAPAEALRNPDRLGRTLSRAGARLTKITPWRDSYSGREADNEYSQLLAEAARGLRASGLGIIGAVRPPAGLFGQRNLAEIVAEDADRLADLLTEAGRRIGLFMDGWQWGDDADGSLAGAPAGRNLEKVVAALAEFAGGLPVTLGRRLDGDAGGPFPFRPTFVEAFFPGSEPAIRLWPEAAALFPWLYEPYFSERGRIYPPAELTRLAPAPAADRVEATAREGRRTGTWLSIEPTPAHSHEPNASSEETQLEQLLIRGVYAAILAPDAVFLGDLFDPRRGMLRPAGTGDGALETVARPIFLAAATLAEQLEGAEYLGRLGLLAPFEAHVFRRAGTDAAVIAIWQNGPAGERTLARREIANGPPLELVDWAGNRAPLPLSIPVRHVPSFITGLSADLALTRMSVRVAPEPAILSSTRRQNQILEVVNHMPRQAPILFRLRYAARPGDGAMENGWTVTPEEIRVNLPPVSPAFAPGRLRYSVSPDPNSPAQSAGPGRADKSGLKIAQAAMTVNTSPPADMLLYLPFRLTSGLDVDIEPLERADDPRFLTLQLKLRWYPVEPGRRRAEIRLVPFHVKKGQMKETAPFPVTVKASPAEERGRPDAGFETVELRIPRSPRAQTWIGLSEDGGSAFYLADVTDFF